MSWIHFCSASFLFFTALGMSHADNEDQLFDRFRRQNQATAQTWRNEVESALARVSGLSVADPQAAKVVLQSTLDAMNKDAPAPGEDRTDLRRRLHIAMATLDAAIASRKQDAEQAKREWARQQLEKRPDITRPTEPHLSPPFFSPLVAPLPNFATLQVTPVVSADRRYVRLGISGGFVVPRVHYTALPVITPTILQGPGNGVTVLPIYGVRYQMVPVPAFAAGAINTTFVAPSGGSISIGGYSSSYYSSVSSGVPILSGVPYVNRLFGNRSFGASSSGFGLSVSPRVIILD